MVTILTITITEGIIIIEIMDLLSTNMEEVEILIIMAAEQEILIAMVAEEEHEIKENVTSVIKLVIWLEIVLIQMVTKTFGVKVLVFIDLPVIEILGITNSEIIVINEIPGMIVAT